MVAAGQRAVRIRLHAHGRHPLVLRAAVLLQEGRRPGPRQRVRGHRHEDRASTAASAPSSAAWPRRDVLHGPCGRPAPSSTPGWRRAGSRRAPTPAPAPSGRAVHRTVSRSASPTASTRRRSARRPTSRIAVDFTNADPAAAPQLRHPGSQPGRHRLDRACRSPRPARRRPTRRRRCRPATYEFYCSVHPNDARHADGRVATYRWRPRHSRHAPPPTPRTLAVYEWLTTTDHKKIGVMYIVTAFALLPARRHPRAAASARSWPCPGLQFVDAEHATTSSSACTRIDDDLPVRDADDRPASRTTSCRSRSAPRTWPSRASTRCRSGCCRWAAPAHRQRVRRSAAPPTRLDRCTRRSPRQSRRTGIDLLLMGLVAARLQLDPRRHQLPRHDLQDARAGH